VGSLIDSGIFVAAERGRIDLEAVMAEAPLADEPVALAAVTASELLHGVHRADPARRAAREASVEAVLAQFPVVAFDLAVARTYGRLVAERAAQGRPIAPHDLMIAATALTIGYRVITRDARSFPTVAGLDVWVR
jgi:tRNA(fMet)-specific endonuclease VapC